VIYYYNKDGQVAWFFTRLIRKDHQLNTLFVWDGKELNITHTTYMTNWATKTATLNNLHDLMVHLWNAKSIILRTDVA